MKNKRKRKAEEADAQDPAVPAAGKKVKADPEEVEVGLRQQEWACRRDTWGSCDTSA